MGFPLAASKAYSPPAPLLIVPVLPLLSWNCTSAPTIGSPVWASVITPQAQPTRALPRAIGARTVSQRSLLNPILMIITPQEVSAVCEEKDSSDGERSYYARCAGAVWPLPV